MDCQTMFDHQRRREPQVRAWLDALDLQPGGRVLDIGCGPGFVSLQAARRVGAQGRVHAVDVSADALAFLERMQAVEGIHQIDRVQADATHLGPVDPPADAALLTMMLHHTADPAAVLRRVAGLLAPAGRVLVAEFHPDGPCEVGPPQDHRIAPETVEAWGRAAGLSPTRHERQSPEHYMTVFQRSAG